MLPIIPHLKHACYLIWYEQIPTRYSGFSECLLFAEEREKLVLRANEIDIKSTILLGPTAVGNKVIKALPVVLNAFEEVRLWGD